MSDRKEELNVLEDNKIVYLACCHKCGIKLTPEVSEYKAGWAYCSNCFKKPKEAKITKKEVLNLMDF